MSGYVELYNQGGTEFLKRVSLKHAMQMIWRGVARAIETDGSFNTSHGAFERPKTLELVRYIYTKWRYEKKVDATVTRNRILKRDKHICAYCGVSGANTIDHIQPKSRGGEDSWLNLVTACLQCNNLKDDRYPKEAGMKLKYEPRVPSFAEVYSWGRT